jgi:hypothetical protein
MHACSIPPAALRDENAVEIARVWIAEQGLHCSMKIGLYAAEDGPETEIKAWGIILADLTQHIANALSAEGFGARSDLHEALVEALTQELNDPTSPARGEWASKPS